MDISKWDGAKAPERRREVRDGKMFCTGCLEWLPVSEYRTRVRNGRTGFRISKCGPCDNKRRRVRARLGKHRSGQTADIDRRLDIDRLSAIKVRIDAAAAKDRANYRLLVSLYPVGTRVFDPDCGFYHKNLGTVVAHHPATGCIQVNVDRDYASEPLWIFAGCVVAEADVQGITA